MLKYTELIQQIECLMDDPTAAPMEKIAELSTAYSEACEWVNEKTLFCVNILRQGNASEALRLCREMDVLENYKTLVFDDYEAWLSAALTFGDVAIPAFNRRLIDELDAAETCMRPIEEILKSHRILAMSHSPLSVRIPVLRKLVELDPRNTGWKNELRDYETARMEYIYEELSQNLTYNDFQKLLKEIEGSKWSIEIPLKIKRKAAAIRLEYQKINRQKQIEQYNAKLNEIADRLVESYNAYDFEGAKKWRDSWFDVLREYQNLKMVPPYDLTHSVDDVLAWINNEQEGQKLLQEYNSKVAAVDRELRRSMSIDKCQRLILDLSRAADAIGQPVPERFQRHLDKLIANDERKAKRHSRFVTSIFTIVLLVVIGGIALGVYGFIYWRNFHSLLDTLSNYQLAVSKDRSILPEAYQFVQNLESSGYQLALYPEVQNNIAYIKQLYEDEKVRHNKWNSLHDSIKQSIEKGEATALEKMKELEDMSYLKEEKEAVEDLRKNNSGLLKQIYDKYVEAQNEKLQGIQQTVNDLLDSSNSETVVKLRKIENQVLQLKQDFADYAFSNPSLQKESQLFETKCDDLTKDIQTAIQRLNTDSSMSIELERLALKIKSPSAYVQALTSIIEKNKDSSYADDFRAVINDQDVWGKAYVWNDFVEQNMSVFRGGYTRTSKQLKDFIEQWNSLSFKPKSAPLTNKINNRIPYFQHIVDCNTAAAVKPLKNLCLQYSRADLWFHEGPDGKRYFFNKRPELENGRQFLYYMTTVSTQSSDKVPVNKTDSVNSLNNREYSQKVNSILVMINENTKFTECGIKTIDLIYRDSTLKDPVIKYHFLMTALESFSKSDMIIQESFNDYIQKLNNDELKQCNPFDLNKGSGYRKEAERMWERLKGFDKSIEEANNLNRNLQLPFDVDKLEPVGWLDKDGAQWIVKGFSSDVSGELYIVQKSDVVSVGTVNNKNVVINSVPNGKRGLPVFMIKTMKP